MSITNRNIAYSIMDYILNDSIGNLDDIDSLNNQIFKTKLFEAQLKIQSLLPFFDQFKTLIKNEIHVEICNLSDNSLNILLGSYCKYLKDKNFNKKIILENNFLNIIENSFIAFIDKFNESLNEVISLKAVLSEPEYFSIGNIPNIIQSNLIDLTNYLSDRLKLNSNKDDIIYKLIWNDQLILFLAL